MKNNIDVNIKKITPLLSPEMVLHKLPSTAEIDAQVEQNRAEISDIIHGKDDKLLVIIGPCSIHDKSIALEYARKLKQLEKELGDKIKIVMRVYFEKPRTTIGWKGLINDPYLDNSLAINEGLMLARKILLAINKIGLATATEFVDTITPQYISDLVCWAAIGARTAESQPHRMLASGLSMPVGFKNNTAGCVNAAVNAVLSALSSHSFLSITQQGVGAIVETEGNKDCHIILRGGASGPNYSSADVAKAAELLQQKNLDANIMIDCSHDNCNKDYTLQAKVIDDVCTQLHQESHHVMGLMIESNLVAGKQSLQPGAKLTYGQSITDGCIGWEETEIVLRKLAKA